VIDGGYIAAYFLFGRVIGKYIDHRNAAQIIHLNVAGKGHLNHVVLNLFAGHVQQGYHLFTEFILGQIGIAVADVIPETVADPALDAKWAVRCYAQFGGDLIGLSEAHAADLFHQSVRVLPDQLHTVFAVFFVEPQSLDRGDAVALEEQRHIGKFPVLGEGLTDGISLLPANARHPAQLFRFLIDNAQGILTKDIDDGRGCLGSDAFYHTRSKKTLNSYPGGRHFFHCLCKGKLLPIPGMDLEGSRKLVTGTLHR